MRQLAFRPSPLIRALLAGAFLLAASKARAGDPAASPAEDRTWPLDGADEGILRDASGASAGRIAGGSFVDGIRGKALLLDGRAAFASLGDIRLGDRDFTIAAWVCPRAVATKDRVIAARDRSGVGSNQLRFYLGAGNRLGFMMSDSAGNHVWPFETAEGSVPARRWSLVAVTRRGPDLTLTVDGKVVGAKSSGSTIAHRNDLELRLGARHAAGGDGPDLVFDGAVDDLRIVIGRALPPGDLRPAPELLEAAKATVAFPAPRRRPEALARPTAEQAAWQDMEVGMFIHFAPNTWQDQEYDDLSTPLSAIDPSRLDTDQWASVAESMGARYVVFVAKHVGGFCWWQTETTDYSVRSIPWRGGKGDVLRDLSESCRKRGIALGVYLSPADGKHGAGVGGKCATQEAQERYARLYRAQLTEVLSRYGEMCEVWFDGSLVIEVGDILREHAPRAMVFQGKHTTIRWVGNEEGIAPYPAWNSVLSTRDPASWGVHTAADGDPMGDRWLPNECDARIRRDWFWSTRNAGTLKTVDQLLEMYYGSVGRGAVFLLNNTPDTTGLIPEADARRSAEFGAEVRRRFGTSIAETSGRGEEVLLELGTPTAFDHAVAMEEIREGERVLEYVIEAAGADGAWREVCRGTSVGHKRIDRFPPVEAVRVRWRSIEALAEPIIRRFAVYRSGEGAVAPAGEGAGVAPGGGGPAKVGELEPAAVRAAGGTVDLDLRPHVTRAEQYEVTFRKPGGGAPFDVAEAVLLIDGVEAPHLVRRIEPGRYNLNVTGIGRSMVLRVRPGTTDATVEVRIGARS